MTTEHLSSPSLAAFADPRLDGEAERILTAVLAELRRAEGSELRLSSGAKTGGIFVHKGKIAWVTASSIKRTLTDRLVSYGVPHAALNRLYQECRTTSRNFAEVIVEWGLIPRDALRKILLHHVSRALLEVLCWNSVQLEVIPSERAYRGNLTFELTELLAQAANHDAFGLVGIGRLSALAASAPAPAERSPSAIETSQPFSLSERAQAEALSPSSDPGSAPQGTASRPHPLDSLRTLKGYTGCGLVKQSGEPSHLHLEPGAKLGLQPEPFAQCLRQLFASAEASAPSLFPPARPFALAMRTGRGTLLARLLGGHAAGELLFCSIDGSGNTTLASMELDRVAEALE